MSFFILWTMKGDVQQNVYLFFICIEKSSMNIFQNVLSWISQKKDESLYLKNENYCACIQNLR